MKVIIDALQDVSAGNLIVWIIAVASVLGSAFKLSKKAYSSAKRFFNTQQNENSEYEKYRNLISKHTNEIKETKDKLKSIDDQLQNIVDMMNEQVRIYNEDKITQYRASIWQQHREFTTQEYVTESGLKTFRDCVEKYEARGGNDIVHTKLAPEVYALPIRYDISKKEN